MVLFLDYDGTLSPIVEQPDKAFMNEGMRPVLAEVRCCVCRVCRVCRRSLSSFLSYAERSIDPATDYCLYALAQSYATAPLLTTVPCSFVVVQW